MADLIEPSPFGNFGIQDTMRMGLGDATLLNDLMSPETSTSSPEELEPIVKEVKQSTPKPVPDISKGKEIVDKEEKDLIGQDILKNFLGGGEEEEENIDEEITSQDAPVEEQEVSQFKALSKDLFKLDVFHLQDEEEEPEINTPEEFLERFKLEKQRGAIETVNNFISQFGEDYQDAFQAIYVKGVNPKDYFSIYNKITDFANLDLSIEENQIAVMRQALTDQGLDLQDISDEIEQIKNYGDLENKSNKYHKVLVKKEALKLQEIEQTAQAELQQKAAIRNQYIQNVQSIVQEKLKNKEFDGIPLNPKLASELQDFLLVDKYKTSSGEHLTDFDRVVLEMKRPENHAMKVKVALLLKILEKDPTLSTIQRSGVTKKSDQLFGEVARQVTKVKSSSPSQSASNSWFS